MTALSVDAENARLVNLLCAEITEIRSAQAALIAGLVANQRRLAQLEDQLKQSKRQRLSGRTPA